MTLMSEMIESTAAILARENGWCQRAGTRDAGGHSCAYDSPNAVAHCVDGACYRAAYDLGLGQIERYNTYGRTIEFVENFIKEKHKKSLIKFNDDPAQTQVGVITMLKEAATKAREKEVPADVGAPPVQLG